MSHIIATKPTVNVRRGPNTVAGIVGTISVGEQLEVVGEPIPGSGVYEKWIQVRWPKDLSLTAYVCLTLAGGGKVCDLVVEAPIHNDEAYNKGYMDGRKYAISALIAFMQKELEG